MDQLRLTTLDDRAAWLRPFVAAPAGQPFRAQLVLLPHAGGNAYAYRSWVSVLPPGVALSAVEYPGHGSRVAEPAVADPAVMVAALTGLLADVRNRLDGTPLILGGHSLGALLAHEIAAVSQTAGRPVDGLLLSGAVPAHRRAMVPDLSLLDDEALAATLGADGDIPAEVLEDDEAREFFLPLVRDGLVFANRLCRAVTAADGGPRGEPVHARAVVVGGADDTRCPAAGLGSWADVIDGPLDITVLPGGHFYHREQLDAVGRLIAGLVDRMPSS